MENEPHVDVETVESLGRFLAYKTLNWTDAYGVRRQWETADRVANRGAVLVFARLQPSDRIVLIRQYRPPARRYCIECPAGLMDDGETAEAAAARELREETGYTARTMTVYPPAYTSPGMTNESVYLVKAVIDETAPENQNPQTDFDPSESIETLLVKTADLADFYLAETAKGTAFDAKAASFILTVAADRLP